jgi:V/A-type H+/Na+-transporting ATPase subunit K
MRRILLALLSGASAVMFFLGLPLPVGAVTTAVGQQGQQYLAAGLAFGLAALGAGVGVGTSGSAAIAAVTEKAEVRTTALIFVVLAEAIAIYGFAIAFIILGS